MWYATLTGGKSEADLLDLAPGALDYGITVDSSEADKFYGEFWITYTVTLDGTRLSTE